jgi:hypothetical protein
MITGERSIKKVSLISNPKVITEERGIKEKSG